MATIKEMFGKTPLELAAQYGVGIGTVYRLQREGKLADAIKVGLLQTSKYRRKYGMNLTQLAVELQVEPHTISSMERLSVLEQARQNAKKLSKK